jgi:hypothetical protein
VRGPRERRDHALATRPTTRFGAPP